MEDSFNARVGKVFGSLDASFNSRSLPLSSLWTLADDEIEKREWNRDKKTLQQDEDFFHNFPPKDKNNAINFGAELEKDLDDLDDEEEEARASSKEDAYDKVSVGRVKNGERLYMKDVNDYDIDVDSGNVLPTVFKDFSRDPPTVGVQADISGFEDGNLKPILKRKGPERTNYVLGEAFLTEEDDMVSNEVSTLSQDYPSGIPAYMQNPSKYTRYTLYTGDVDDESNRPAYMDFLKLVRRSDSTEPHADDALGDLTKPVTFIPGRKIGDVVMGENCGKPKQTQEGTDKEPMHKGGLPIGIAAGDTDGVCAMDEDEPQTIIENRNSSQREGRQYRMKSCSE
ncbi:SET domain protein [Hibiscus syriacus]|uniref:U5 small nuclear ribonucleoprotein TSSC4 n=2 Tax=Hibiscus syriacus TaxID=106335 RepID=A0A6A3BTC8_HIBSY|nr:SET domain protein [Hibiscus syriacus]